MKIAICFYGLVGSISDKNGKGKSINPELGFNYFKKNILNPRDDFHVFIHSWSIDQKSKLLELYNPNDYIIETQKIFKNDYWLNFSLEEIRAKITFFLLFIVKNNNFKKLYNLKIEEYLRAKSRWYSVKQSIDLMKKYEQKNNIKFDCVMSTRLDVAFFKKINFSDYNMNYFYASNWNDAPNKFNNFTLNYKNNNEGKGLLDFWFFSNSNNMKAFAKLYNRINYYPVCPHFSSKKHLDYLKITIRYIFYRWVDHEMIRRKFFKSEK